MYSLHRIYVNCGNFSVKWFSVNWTSRVHFYIPSFFPWIMTNNAVTEIFLLPVAVPWIKIKNSGAVVYHVFSVALAYCVRSLLKNKQQCHTQKSVSPLSVSILWIKMRIEVLCAGYGNTITCEVICLTICSWWQDTCWYPSHQDLLYHLENWPVHLDRRVYLSHQAHRPCPWSPSCEPGMCKTWAIKHSEKEWWNSVSL